MRLESKGLPDAMDGALCLATVLRVLHFGIADFARLDRSGRIGQPCQPIFSKTRTPPADGGHPDSQIPGRVTPALSTFHHDAAAQL